MWNAELGMRYESIASSKLEWRSRLQKDFNCLIPIVATENPFQLKRVSMLTGHETLPSMAINGGVNERSRQRWEKCPQLVERKGGDPKSVESNKGRHARRNLGIDANFSVFYAV